MPLPFRKVSQDQLTAMVARYPFARPVDSVLLLPSGSPDRGFPEPVSLAALWKRDTGRGEPDVTWHLAVDSEGGLWLGRDWNLPAGPRGAGSSPDTSFVILLLDGAPREAAQRAAALFQDRIGGAASAGGDGDDAAADALVMELMRGSGTVVGRAPVAATMGRTGLESVGEEGIFPRKITAEMKETLRPHVINLTRGQFSSGGLFDTSQDDVDALFGEHLERAVAGHGPGDPLRVVIWAHGGLVSERNGLLGAYDKILWWRKNGVYPIYFVWETGFLQSVGQLLGGHGGGEEGVFDFTDKRLEEIARRAGGPAIWGVMKQNAHAAVAPSGGAFFAAQRLADFCRRHPGAVELHAGAHSAGAIFHASFLPAALDQGVPPFKALHLLAPAVRADLFLERLAPRLGPGKGVERTAIFTMNKDREQDDNCAFVYRKSLLYLIHFALEEERETPILGLEISLRGNDDLKRMFGLGGAGGTPVGEVIWSKTTAAAPPRSRSESTSHSGFNDDAATLDSVLRRILDRDDIPLPFKQAGSLTPETAVPSRTPAPAAPAIPAGPAEPSDIILGDEEGVEEEGVDEGEGVPFIVLDAIERATEAAEGIGAQAGEPVLEGIGLEAVGAVAITFGPNARPAALTDFSRGVLTDILRAAGLSRAVISSTSRSPADQARVMFVNLEREGIEAQRRLYREPGRKVIEVYRQARLAGKGAAAIQALMTAEIVRLGPTNVSRHASDPKILNVFDVAPGSIANRPVFEARVRAEGRVAKFLLPPTDPGYHLEIPQPPGVASPRLG
ncbi:MAG TPA: hypothetical protein VLB76_10045 [Thermoanaerobaculia bacterium]|jgi:hypothetical protein|nr:hypothetical protein [Thermoanaerobaculia bacterium]